MQTYQDRINEVLKYIHFHMEDNLDLDKLASIAFISKFHFHRIMRVYLGESLGAYINRIRVETGAKLLKYSDDSITDIAFTIGYEIPTSFNKSFKKQFGVSPSQFRKEPNHSFNTIKIKRQKTNFELVVEKKVIQPIIIICNPSKGKIGSKETEEVWNELMDFALKNDLFSNNTKLYGIHWDDPSITLKEHMRYDACISVIEEKKDSKYPIKKLSGGKHLCFTYKGDYRYLGDVYDQIFRDFILKDNLKLKEGPIFEQYLNDRYQTPAKNLLTKIFIPIF
jgi:AraC family transcriptional regulator